ncbi:MAG: hypothetical protein H0Z33_14410 [Bacillaceae bacterium]|nr:hypothetical protein [Bacillaceae bacterium]
MLKRKLIAAVIVSIIADIIFATPFVIDVIRQKAFGDVLAPFGVVALYAVPAIFLYGLPVSLLSDYVTGRVHATGHTRRWLAFIIHLAFGMGFILIWGLLFDADWLFGYDYWMGLDPFRSPSVIASVLFWMVDEILRKRKSL